MKGLFLSLILLSLAPELAEARIYIVIDTPSEELFPIAVANLTPEENRKSKQWSEELPKRIRDDLELSGLFEILSPTGYPKSREALSPDPTKIQFAPWTVIGAQALVHGSYKSVEGGVTISLHLYDPFLGQLLTGKSYRAKEGEIAVIAHHFADEVMRSLTGERGVFSTQIAFICRVRKYKELCTMDMDGENRRQLTRHRSIVLSPDWSPSGREIAYSAYRDGQNPEIHLIEAGKEPQQLTFNNSINLSPSWTPNGLLTFATATEGDTELYLMNLRGRIVSRLTQSFGIDINPCWSPDGRFIVYASERAGKLHLFRANSRGTEIQRLTYVGYQNDNPAWSPRGDKILFQGRDEGVWDIFIMNTDGSMIQRLTSDSGDNESPSWAPNGRMIVFSSTRRGTYHLYIMREDGSHQMRIGPQQESRQPDWGPWFQ